MARADKAIVIESPYLLLCEGEDEVNFFSAWLPEIPLTGIQILAYGGKTKLGTFLADLPKLRGFEKVRRVAILRDADDDPNGARDSVQYAIQHSPVNSLNPPFFILPDNGRPGALEALWLESLANAPFAPCVDEFFKCIEGKGWTRSTVFGKNDKAKAQLWIATKGTPNERFGIAAWHGRKDTDKAWMKDRWVDFAHPAFAHLKAFLVSAFTE